MATRLWWAAELHVPVLDQDPEQKQAKLQAKREKEFHGSLRRFCRSLPGDARRAYEAGDHVFQCSIGEAGSVLGEMLRHVVEDVHGCGAFK